MKFHNIRKTYVHRSFDLAPEKGAKRAYAAHASGRRAAWKKPVAPQHSIDAQKLGVEQQKRAAVAFQHSLDAQKRLSKEDREEVCGKHLSKDTSALADGKTPPQVEEQGGKHRGDVSRKPSKKGSRWRLPFAVAVLALGIVCGAVWCLSIGIQQGAFKESYEGKITAIFSAEEMKDVEQAPNDPLSDERLLAALRLFAEKGQGDPISYHGAALDMASGNADELECFDFASQTTLPLDEEAKARIEDALRAFTDKGYQVGFVLYDVNAGKVLAANANGSLFSASTVKAPFAAYLMQTYVASGAIALDAQMPKITDADTQGPIAHDGASSYPLSEVIEHTIVESDNNGYAMLRNHFGKNARTPLAEGNDGFQSFSAWAEDTGVHQDGLDQDDFPSYSPLQLAHLWLGVASYLAEGQSESLWFADLLKRTDPSFLREALGDEETLVLAKAGYEVDNAYYRLSAAINDAGLLYSHGHLYLFSVMSDAGYDSAFDTGNEAYFADLAQAVFAFACSDEAPSSPSA